MQLKTGSHPSFHLVDCLGENSLIASFSSFTRTHSHTVIHTVTCTERHFFQHHLAAVHISAGAAIVGDAFSNEIQCKNKNITTEFAVPCDDGLLTVHFRRVIAW